MPPSPPGFGRIHQFGPAGDSREREAARQALGHRGDVRRDIVMLHREHLAGARKARLDLVGNQQDAVLVANLAQRRHEIARRFVEPALALHRLKDDRSNARWIDIGLEQAVERGKRIGDGDAVQRYRKRRVENIARHGAEADLVGHDLAGQRHAHEGAPVETAGKGDDCGAAGGMAGDLDSVFHCLGAGGDEDGLLVSLARNEPFSRSASRT